MRLDTISPIRFVADGKFLFQNILNLRTEWNAWNGICPRRMANPENFFPQIRRIEGDTFYVQETCTDLLIMRRRVGCFEETDY